MSDKRDIDSTTSYTLSTNYYTDTLDTYTHEWDATQLTKELWQLDPTEIIEWIRNLTIDHMTSQEPNPVMSFLGSGIKILASDITDAKIAH